EETVWMQDLNSTNGTYHNGMRLKPHEKVALETEDEIGFGQMQFVFR
ncbi:MAG: FHA domain-containing protein, partial [Lachnospiraceae bacterium]|nr:FHA domain-containing protein [Lachnospiraceae bacterium]